MSRLLTYAELEQACARLSNAAQALSQAATTISAVAEQLAMHADALSSHRALPAVELLPDDPTPTRSWVGWRPREEE